MRDYTKEAFACLYGLIRAVEKEADVTRKLVATMTSLLVLGFVRLIGTSPSA